MQDNIAKNIIVLIYYFIISYIYVFLSIYYIFISNNIMIK